VDCLTSLTTRPFILICLSVTGEPYFTSHASLIRLLRFFRFLIYVLPLCECRVAVSCDVLETRVVAVALNDVSCPLWAPGAVELALLRFQAGGRTTRPNPALVLCVYFASYVFSCSR